MKQKMHKQIIVATMLLLAANFLFTLPVFGADCQGPECLWGNNSLKNTIKDNSGLPSEVSDPREVAANIIRFVLGFLGILAVIIIVYAGFKWMLSGGSEDQVSEAKKMLVAALIGLVIILAAYALAEFVINTLYEAAQRN